MKLFSALFVAVLITFLAGGQVATPINADEIEEIDLNLFVTAISLSDAPYVEQEATVTYVVTPTISVASASVILELPNSFNVSDPSPAGSSVDQGEDPWNDHLTLISWEREFEEGVPQTFTVDFSSNTDTDGLFETITGVVENEATNYTQSAFVKIGVTQNESDLTSQIVLDDIVDHSIAEHDVQVANGTWSSIQPADSVNTNSLPTLKPVLSRLRFSEVPDSNDQFTMYLDLVRTVNSTVSYSGVVHFPDNWTVQGSSTSLSGSLTSSSVVSIGYLVTPNTITHDWDISAEFSQLSVGATQYKVYTLKQDGGVNASGEGRLWEQKFYMEQDGELEEEYFLAAKNDSTMSTQSTVCPTCVDGTLPSFLGKRVIGNVQVDKYAASFLKVELWRYTHPGFLGWAPKPTVIGQTLTEADGSYEFIICLRGDTDPMWVRTVAYSTDHALDHGSIVVRPESGDPPAYNYTKGIFDLDDICTADISYKVRGKKTDPFIIATFYADDCRRFVEDNTELNPHSGIFPFNAYWPFYDFEFHGSYCWENCWINVEHARNFPLIAHEYAHHTHHAAGGEITRKRFYEGWAIFQEGVQEVSGNYMRGVGGGNTWLESKTHDGQNDGQVAVEGAAGYLWDLWDSVNTEPYDLQNCDSSVADATSINFNTLLTEYAQADDLSELLGESPGFYESYDNPTTNFRAISFNHLVTDGITAESACFP